MLFTDISDEEDVDGLNLKDRDFYLSILKQMEQSKDKIIYVDEPEFHPPIASKLLDYGYFLSIGPNSPDSYDIRISREFIAELGSWSNITKENLPKINK